MSPFFFFALGLIFLLSGSRGIIINSLIISRFTKIPPFIIGATVIAIGTSLPEIVVSFFGGIEKASDLALGDIVGSNIVNIGLVLGLSLLLQPLYIGREKTQKSMLVCLAVSLSLFAILLIDGISIFHGLFLVLLGFGVIIWEVIQGKKSGLTEKISIKNNRSPLFATTLLVLSLFSLFIGGKFLVDAGIDIANLFHVPQAIIGITAIAIGTSLPELAVSVAGLIKKATISEEKLVIGNILGSNIFNILFGAGILGIFGVKHFSDLLSLFVFLIFTLILFFLIHFYRGKFMPKFIGFILISSYCLYLFILFLEI
jgi:cation:H+ antiporter